MRVRGQIPDNTEQGILGPAGNVEFVPLLIPMRTYQTISEQAKELGCTVAEVFERAISEYLKSVDSNEVVVEAPRAAPVTPPQIVIKRRR